MTAVRAASWETVMLLKIGGFLLKLIFSPLSLFRRKSGHLSKGYVIQNSAEDFSRPPEWFERK